MVFPSLWRISTFKSGNESISLGQVRWNVGVFEIIEKAMNILVNITTGKGIVAVLIPYFNNAFMAFMAVGGEGSNLISQPVLFANLISHS